MTTSVTRYTFTSLAAGARDVKGILWRCKSNHATHALLPIAYRDFQSATAANGQDFKVNVGKRGFKNWILARFYNIIECVALFDVGHDFFT